MPRYAADTSVSTDRSRQEIEAVLRRYGADAFMYGWEANRVLIGFQMAGRRIRMELRLPDPQSPAFRYTANNRLRSENSAREAYEQATRQQWRAFALVIKAKLEWVESGQSTLEREFLADIVLPDGSTVGQWTLPQVEKAYLTGAMPPLLPSPTE